MDSGTLRRRIIFRRLIQILIVLAIFVMAISPINYENDIFWQLKMGEQIVKYHYFPTTDIFNFSNPTAVWTLHEWLPSVLFYLTLAGFGSVGLIILKAFIISLTFGLFLLYLNKIKANLYLSLFVFFLAIMVNTRGTWVVFPSIFEYLFIMLTLLILETYIKNRRLLFPLLLIPLSLLWANSHGSFFLLPGITTAYLLNNAIAKKLSAKWPSYNPQSFALNKKERQTFLIIIFISLITPLITPNGFWTYLYPFRITFGSFTGYVSEYQKFWTIWVGNWSDFVLSFTLILLIILGFLLVLSLKKLRPVDFILATTFTLFALTAVRHVAVFALVALFLICRYLTLWFGEYRGVFSRSLIRDILVIILIICFTYYYKSQVVKFGFTFSETDYPKAAAELINNSGIKGNMFNHYNYGGYLIWKMPKHKVFIDGRLEMYEGQAGKDYMSILWAKKGYKELLKKYNINFFILNVSDPIVETLANDSLWKYVFNDNQYVVFVKDAPENKTILAKEWSSDRQTVFREVYGAYLSKYKSSQYTSLGVKAYRENNKSQALAAFYMAVRQDPGSVNSHLNLAQVYLSFGMREEAKKEFEFILFNLDSTNKVALENLKLLE